MSQDEFEYGIIYESSSEEENVAMETEERTQQLASCEIMGEAVEVKHSDENQKQSWANLWQKKNPVQKKETKKTCHLPVTSSSKLPLTGKDSCSSDALSSQQQQKRKTKSKHSVGWKQEYLLDPLFCEWIHYDAETNTITCSICQKHPQHTVSIGMNKNYIVGVDAEGIRRDSLRKHCNSNGHTKALKNEASLNNPNENLEAAVQKMNEKQLQDFKTFFDTAHAMCKRERPITDYPKELDYLTRNSTRKFEVNRYRTRESGKDFIVSMGEDITAEIVAHIKACGFFSLMIDKGSDRSGEKATDIYIRSVKEFKAFTSFLCIVPVTRNATADNILFIVDKGFRDLGFPEWKDYLVGFGCDGAAVNTGVRRGIGTQLKQEKPHVLTIHCAGHRLQLGCKDVFANHEDFQSLKTGANCLYNFYFWYPNNWLGLTNTASSLTPQRTATKPPKLEGPKMDCFHSTSFNCFFVSMGYCCQTSTPGCCKPSCCCT